MTAELLKTILAIVVILLIAAAMTFVWTITADKAPDESEGLR